MKFASVEKNGISVDIMHDDEDTLDWFLDNDVKITSNKLPFVCSDPASAREIIKASKNEEFAEDYIDLYESNVRFSMIAHEDSRRERSYMLMVFVYPLDLSEDEIREEYSPPDYFFMYPSVSGAHNALDKIYEVVNSLQIQDDFVGLGSYEAVFTDDGVYKYYLN